MADENENQNENEDLDLELEQAVRDQEKSLLSDAFKPADQVAKEEAAEAEQSDQEAGPEAETDDGQPRNERGQFVSKEAQPDATAAPTAGRAQPAPTPRSMDEKSKDETEAPGDEQGGDKDAGESVPRWRLREIAEERRAAQAERDALRAELARVQAAQFRQQQSQPQQQPIDPLLDPQGYRAAERAYFDQQLQMMRLDNSLELAHMRHGEYFEKAYSALLGQGQAGNTQLVNHLTNQRNPGAAIVSWYQNQELLRETGGNVGDYKNKLKAELLKDPEFLKAAADAIRGGVAQPGQGKPTNITRLPPSLSRQTGSAPRDDTGTDTDDSDRAVFESAWR